MFEVRPFIRSLRSLYRQVLLETGRGLRANLHHYLLHIALVCAASGAFVLTRDFGGVLGALLSGLVFTIFLSVYLSSVSAGVQGQPVSFVETLRVSYRLFPAVLQVLAVLFLCTVIVHALTRSSLVMLFINLCIVIFWNAALEICYQDNEDAAWQDLRQAWQFVRVNAFEWFLPVFVVGLMLVGIEGLPYAQRVFLLLFGTHPVQFIQILSNLGSSVSSDSGRLIQSVLFLLFLYPTFIFRGVLYKSLLRTNRRKRIFEAKF